jgi:hypothetical protein
VHSPSSLVTAIKEPRRAIVELNRIYDYGVKYPKRQFANEDGIDVMAEDWDTLIILDACRYDEFAKYAETLPGTLEMVKSQSTATVGFLRANFGGRDFDDTVYVTANPQLYRLKNGIHGAESVNTFFHDTVEVWKDGWSEEHRTVLPDVVTDAALDAAEQYPNKRLVIHYLQPHAPYIGETGRDEFPTDYLNFWASYRKGEFDIDLSTATKAYRENLELVLPHIETLLTELTGKSVVTADHGELLGERDRPVPLKRYGHPHKTPLRPLLEVPWLTHTQGNRRTIISEERSADSVKEQASTDVVEKRLRDLGYR